MIRFHALFRPLKNASLTHESKWAPVWWFHGHAHGYTRSHATTSPLEHTIAKNSLDTYEYSDTHLSTQSRNVFADTALITVHAGSGGNGCISFLREKYLDNGPANGGDGGNGGGVYIQAVKGETSLHKLARRKVIRAGKGQHGKGKSKGGQRGEDVVLQVPIGTVVREVSRHDPVADESAEEAESFTEELQEESIRGKWRRDKWLLHPGAKPADYATTVFPRLPEGKKSHLLAKQPDAPIYLDLSQPMETPLLLASGAPGGCGNPHFVSSSMPKPKIATRGDKGISITLEMELKLLADLGFVGMPNAGKSTLLRALSRSQARVGHWAFTTLSPNIGTMILDNGRGRPQIRATTAEGDLRTSVTIADIPGLINDAHLDKGLGLGFLRHIERAKVLAFVIDLSSGNAVESLKNLWRELREFEGLRDMETNRQTQTRINGMSSQSIPERSHGPLYEANLFSSGSEPRKPFVPSPPISTKPWFVVATKGDLDGTQENYEELKQYLNAIESQSVSHPCGKQTAWKGPLAAIPVSAIKNEGVEQISQWTVNLLGN